MGAPKPAGQTKLIAKNKKAYFDYEILEKFEAGIMLNGPEVKSIKNGHVQLKGSFAEIRGDRAAITNMHVSPYKCAPAEGYDPLRKRGLLLKKSEIDRLAGFSAQKGLTLIPLEVFLQRGFVKILLGVCRGKKLHDKRLVLKKRAITKEINQGLKKFSR